jgi:hypothetical protein
MAEQNNRNRRLAQARPEGGFALRVYHRVGSEKRLPRYLLKCGCCDQQVEIYYAEDGLEINGVYASVENWREVLLPLLGVTLPAGQSQEQEPSQREVGALE